MSRPDLHADQPCQPAVDQGSPELFASVQRYAGQVGRVAAAWMILGMIVGFLQHERVGSGTIGILSSVTAGAVVYVPLGIALGICGGVWTHSASGGLIGGVVGLASPGVDGLLGDHDLGIAITVGALVATTGWCFVRALTSVMSAGRRLTVSRTSNTN